MIFRGRTLEPIQSEYIAPDDIISVNDIVGWLDFVGQDLLVLIDERGVFRKIAIKDIRSIVKYSSFIEGNMCSVSINELLTA